MCSGLTIYRSLVDSGLRPGDWAAFLGAGGGGEGVHGVFVTATSSAAYSIATKMACIGGRIMCIGMPASGTAIAGDDPIFMILRNLKVIGTLTGSMKDTADALDFAARG
ncbi:hypothetical protein BHE90_002264 [Fusarium euwallaceae]|uniref:Alcohol dehydrogenase-like C-terminal domain-containing protein n=2 Tax=Fusarium solani species complex TaxID=232080 RepID=A0A428S7R4_9HYPO|nr:hypothetical protein CEP52_016005 [Fusarium oligoseptatum]RTE83251.1 hypothetical protein BHE90_002264 [Fusarium euwallaceae]